MQPFEELTEYDLLTKVIMIKTEYGGRKGAVLDGYRGQFFWHINDVNCSDWDAVYFFENGELKPGEESLCKVVLGQNVKIYSKGVFPVGCQFCIREGSKVVLVGVIQKSNLESLTK
jgi:translation elongation factor EF-Tu-like GTPase